MLVHIHGFNSCAASNTFTLLQAAFPSAKALEYPCHGLFANNLALLHTQVTALRGASAEPLVVTGSSLGGFYASQLAALLHMEQSTAQGGACHCGLFNPVIAPAVALRPMLGRNTLIYSGEVWEFTPTMLESYAYFNDTRALPLTRLVVLGRNDALLNPAESRQYWQNYARIHETDDGHSLATLDDTTLRALADMGAE